MHLHSAPTSLVMSKATAEPCFILLLLTPVAPALLHTTVSSALLTSSKALKNTAGWLTSDQEEHSFCGQGIIPTTWTTLCSEQLWALLIQHNTNAVRDFFFLPFDYVWSKIFWHNHICYHTSACQAELRPGRRNWDRKNKERAGKETTRRDCFESPNRLLPSIFRGWNFSLAVRRNSNRWSSCPQPARVEKISTAHVLPDPLSHPSHPVSSLPAR